MMADSRPAAVDEEGIRSPLVRALPLLSIGVVLLGLALTSRAVGLRLGPGRLEGWVLLAGMGAIVLGGGLSALFLRAGSASARRREARDRSPDSAEESSPTEEGGERPEGPTPFEEPAPPIDTSDVPAPAPHPGVGWTSTSAASPDSSSSPRTLAREIDRVLERIPAAVHGTPPVESRPSAPETVPASAAVDVESSCATCHRPLPARSTWRRCQNCGRPLCASCLTESVRQWGGGFCESCAGTVSSRGAQPAPT